MTFTAGSKFRHLELIMLDLPSRPGPVDDTKLRASDVIAASSVVTETDTTEPDVD